MNTKIDKAGQVRSGVHVKEDRSNNSQFSPHQQGETKVEG